MRVISFFLFSLLIFLSAQDSPPPNAMMEENTPENLPNVTIDDAFQNLTDNATIEENTPENLLNVTIDDAFQNLTDNVTIEENTPENLPNVTIDDAFQNLTDELLEEIFTYNISNSGPVEKRTTRLDFLAVWLNAMRGFLADDMMNFIIDRNSEEVINF